MDKKITIHAGRHKTGSTALQTYFYKNQGRLLRHCINYSSCMRTNNGKPAKAHHDLAKLLKGSLPCAKEHLTAISDSMAIGTSKTLISSEVFGTLHARAEEVQLRRSILLLQERFNIDVILYIRNQVDLVRSWWNQKVKIGEISCPPMVFYEQNRYRFNHLPVILFWHGLVGNENLKIRIYEEACIKPGGIFADVNEALGIGPSMHWDTPNERINKSIDVIKRVRLTGQLDKVSLESRDVPSAATEEADMPAYREDDRLSLFPRSLAQDIIRDHEKENEIIATQFLGRPDGMLFLATEPET